MKIAYAVVNEHYLPFAYVTRESFLRHNPGYHFMIFLHGRVNDRCVFDDTILDAEEFLGPDKCSRLNPNYSIFEKSCALKTILGEEIINRNENCTRIVYMDSDLYFTSELDNKINADNISSIFITPHTFKPVLDIPYINDLYILSSGVFNAGYYEFNVTEESRNILKFLNQYMYTFCQCRKSPHSSLFVDQIFYDLIPVYFEHYRNIDHPGYNVSFHNLHERGLRKTENDWQVDSGEKLVFFHFSGLNFNSDSRFSKYYNFDFKSHYPDLAALRREYIELLVKYNYTFDKKPSGYLASGLNFMLAVKNKFRV